MWMTVIIAYHLLPSDIGIFSRNSKSHRHVTCTPLNVPTCQYKHNQGEFQDPQIEVLYHILGVYPQAPYIALA